jgi:uncharacterized protein (TIGR02452 family)
MKKYRRKLAQETLNILKQGTYTTPSGKRVDIADLQKRSEGLSRLITPVDGQRLTKSLPPPNDLATAYCEVINASTVKAIIDMANKSEPVAALNFASAKTPGGGFLNGAMAQEEALAYAGGLYNTLIQKTEYYEKNRICMSMMYTDYAIYSPDVVFFRNADNQLLDAPVTASVLTLPAVNMGQVKAKGEDIKQAEQIMKNRMRLTLVIFTHEEAKTIILGAYGCGVYKNNPNDIARWWHELLFNEGYGKYFNRVLFAVLDKPSGENIGAFKRVFGESK